MSSVKHLFRSVQLTALRAPSAGRPQLHTKARFNLVRVSRPAFSSTSRATAVQSDLPGTRGPSEADLLLEDLEEQYATAQDEYEIALEETQNGTIYAEDDRAAAKEQIEKVLQNYITVMKDEEQKVAGQLSSKLYEKIKKLAEDMAKLEEMASAHD